MSREKKEYAQLKELYADFLNKLSDLWNLIDTTTIHSTIDLIQVDMEEYAEKLCNACARKGVDCDGMKVNYQHPSIDCFEPA